MFDNLEPLDSPLLMLCFQVNSKLVNLSINSHCLRTGTWRFMKPTYRSLKYSCLGRLKMRCKAELNRRCNCWIKLDQLCSDKRNLLTSN
nr:hypothetical transcript [Hymenolepis microstoma]